VKPEEKINQTSPVRWPEILAPKKGAKQQPAKGGELPNKRTGLMDCIRVGIRVRPLNRVRAQQSGYHQLCLDVWLLQDKESDDPSAVWRYDENSITFVKDGQPTNAYTFGTNPTTFSPIW
jgi:hypothetical protein